MADEPSASQPEAPCVPPTSVPVHARTRGLVRIHHRLLCLLILLMRVCRTLPIAVAQQFSIAMVIAFPQGALLFTL